jgi:hypothetical protein
MHLNQGGELSLALPRTEPFWLVHSTACLAKAGEGMSTLKTCKDQDAHRFDQMLLFCALLPGQA